jgi:23S rRNA U2552 (ribose-2'-O)-methylase RlmE/FtsJ
MLNEKILSYFASFEGHLSETQAEYIIEKLKDFKTDNVLEIGFAGGRHTYTILESFNPKNMVSVDINFDYLNGRHKIEDIKKEFDTCTFVEQNSATCLNEAFFTEHFPDGVDYVLVDGGHSYFDAMNDMKNSFPFVNEGGIMIVDDYESKVCPLVEVDRAVRDFSKETGNTFETVSLEDGKGVAVFYKTGDNG